jgi:uncharacterized lipoprotein YehR (DUF1307 family)
LGRVIKTEECVMKNTIKLFGIIALAVVIGFSMAACDDGSKDSGGGLNGTWVSTTGDKMVLKNGSATMSLDDVEVMKGTYSTSGSNFTMNITQINGAMFGMLGLTSKWYTQQEFIEAVIQYFVDQFHVSQSEAEAMLEEMLEEMGGSFGTQTGTYTLDGNTLTLTMDGGTTTFTRQ